LACFAAGNALNWDGRYLAETHARHDRFNTVIERLLNLGGFMFIGLIMPWDVLTSPGKTGLTLGRLFGLGFLVLVLRRIPAIMLSYRFMSDTCRNWKEALFLGYFGPIGR
jgi:NhaP-type Na+/H+ or K+/H+ antiporter